MRPVLIIDEQEIARLPVTSDPEVMSGALVVAGTRVPVEALLSNLEAGLTLDEFLENFPTVTREQAVQVLSSQVTTTKPHPQFGNARGMITIPDDLDEPLEDLKEYM